MFRGSEENIKSRYAEQKTGFNKTFNLAALTFIKQHCNLSHLSSYRHVEFQKKPPPFPEKVVCINISLYCFEDGRIPRLAVGGCHNKSTIKLVNRGRSCVMSERWGTQRIGGKYDRTLSRTERHGMEVKGEKGKLRWEGVEPVAITLLSPIA